MPYNIKESKENQLVFITQEKLGSVYTLDSKVLMTCGLNEDGSFPPYTTEGYDWYEVDFMLLEDEEFWIKQLIQETEIQLMAATQQ